jgi:hypothetical protein
VSRTARPFGQGSRVRSREAPGGPLSRSCPLCGAQIGWRCFRLRSWVDPIDETGAGFFTERQQTVHAERKAGVLSMEAVRRKLELTGRGRINGEFGHGDEIGAATYDQRRRARVLIDAKLTQNRKGPARTFLNSPTRTAFELARYIEKLEAMPDVER